MRRCGRVWCNMSELQEQEVIDYLKDAQFTKDIAQRMARGLIELARAADYEDDKTLT